MRGSSRRTAAALGIVAFTLYAPLLGWGVPHATAPDRTKTFATDEILPLETLAEMHNTFVVSKPDRNYGYPWWHYFVASLVQAPYLAYSLATGRMSRPSPEYPFGFSDPVRALKVLTVLGRLLSAAMGAGVVVAAFFFARALRDDSTAIVAAVLTMLNYLMFYYARTGNLDVPAFFWTAMGVAMLAAILTRGLTIRRGAWLGLFAALAVATKDQSVALFAPLVMLLLLPQFNHPTGQRYQTMPLLVCAGAAIAAYLVGTGMLVDPWRHITHVHAMFFNQSRVTNSALYAPPIPHTMEGNWQLLVGFLAGLVSAMSLPVLVAAAIGVVIAVYDAPWRSLLVLPFVTVFVLLVWSVGEVNLRYLLPLTLFVDFFAAFALVTLKRSRYGFAFAPAVVALCAWRLAMGMDLTYAQASDTRYAAAEWMAAHARAGERVEYFGVKDTLPPLGAEVSSRRIMGRIRWTGEFGHGRTVLDYLRADGPEYLMVIPDWTSGRNKEYSGDCPPEVYEALVEGRTGYRLVAYFAPRTLLPASMARPRLDNPSVSPPVRIFARADVAMRQGLATVGSDGAGRRLE